MGGDGAARAERWEARWEARRTAPLADDAFAVLVVPLVAHVAVVPVPLGVADEVGQRHARLREPPPLAP